ncbi:MAG: hypothetical protein Ta2G_14230 [Termitinemataceae bacterium]|nr:MAG: hypothetical protein Ta2G_14230 [Termitinemataceae bacterium]
MTREIEYDTEKDAVNWKLHRVHLSTATLVFTIHQELKEQTKRKKGAIMGMITLTVRDGQKPTKEQLKRIKAACKKPITYTSDCPESTPAALAEFAAKARALRQNKRNKKPAVTLRIHHESLEVYKSAMNPKT